MLWECKLTDGTILKESEDAKFNLDWEKEGVDTFKLSGDLGEFSVDITKGNFIINGKIDKKNNKGNLVYFKRNKVIIKAQGSEELHRTKSYFIGFNKGKILKLLKINDDGSYEYVKER